jgi:hypothetical protein
MVGMYCDVHNYFVVKESIELCAGSNGAILL